LEGTVDLFNEIESRGIPYAKHYSDLYIPNTDETRALLKDRGMQYSYFRNQVNGEIWLDVPFAYDPYWDERS
jgi:hypothetical protein